MIGFRYLRRSPFGMSPFRMSPFGMHCAKERVKPVITGSPNLI